MAPAPVPLLAGRATRHYPQSGLCEATPPTRDRSRYTFVEVELLKDTEFRLQPYLQIPDEELRLIAAASLCWFLCRARTVRLRVAVSTEGDEVVFSVCSGVRPGRDVMDVKVGGAAAELTSPAVAFQHGLPLLVESCSFKPS